jgi:hypothetical protein
LLTRSVIFHSAYGYGRLAFSIWASPASSRDAAREQHQQVVRTRRLHVAVRLERLHAKPCCADESGKLSHDVGSVHQISKHQRTADPRRFSCSRRPVAVRPVRPSSGRQSKPAHIHKSPFVPLTFENDICIIIWEQYQCNVAPMPQTRPTQYAAPGRSPDCERDLVTTALWLRPWSHLGIAAAGKLLS